MADKNYKLSFAMSDGTTKSVQFTAPQGPKGDDHLFIVSLTADSKPTHSAAEIIAAAAEGKAPVYRSSAGYLLTEWVAAEDGSSVTFTGIQNIGSDDETKVTVPISTIDKSVIIHSEAVNKEKLTGTVIAEALGYKPVDPREYAVSVKAMGAKGDGTTDDTAVFQTALAANRKVYIPGGTYKLSGELVIRDNCQLELAQDVVLNFTQTSGNCITVNRSSWLKGNHAIIFVPYAFAGNVIYADTTLHTSARDVQPWTHYDPQWKTARYVSDINICKYDSAGRHWSEHGDTAGTAIYISATGTTSETPRASTFMWGTNLSGIRIAGAFEYGIRAQNFLKGWLHEMRLEAYIENCKIGLSLEDCNKVYFSGAIQPKKAADGTPYAMHGVQLIRSIDTELSGCRVWDWDATNSLWTFDKTNVNQHIAMYGNCRGTILNDYLYYNLPTGFSDIRELIYTDTLSNFNSLIIVQEPITKWFAPVDNLPYFNNGIDGNQRLLLKSEQDALFQNKQVPNFTNRLPTAIDANGAVFNGTGYKIGGYLKETTGEFVATSYYGCTGYIRCNVNSVIRVIGINWSLGYCGIMLFDSDKNRIMNMSSEAITPGTSYYFGYSEIENGFMLTLKGRAEQAGTYYFRLSFEAAGMGTNPVVTVDEEISYFQDGFLKDGIYVSADYIHGAEYKFVMANQKVVEISTASTDEQYPTAKAVYDLVTTALDSYVNEVDALIGGGS